MSDPLGIMDPFEECPQRTPREILSRQGYAPLSPEQVDDFQMRGRLWELIYALAARRFYLYFTNHLSHRELYTWLYSDWLNDETCDIPPEAEWNTRVSPQGENEDIYLRYYADEEVRQKWAEDFPETTVPLHENPPYDRDRWLPEPPLARQAIGFESSDPFSSDEDTAGRMEEDADPLGLSAVDDKLSEEGLSRDELLAITAGEQSDGWQWPIEKLKQDGQALLPPDELTDESLTGRLWELLHDLACHGFYIQHTDHLSDREVYSELWERGLRDEALLPGKSKSGGWFHDFLGSWSEGDMQIWLSFYATDEERANHQKHYPKDPIPPKEPRPHNRDWRTPKAPFC